ncbi:hypothetical protein BXZ70DRAFT_941491 [Cristinia sonorae]|uniref:BTB domain-containing protein n=1 Tax=Cristinia sonorae TaxID=1940300 RepID=A0A8K0UN73_9AGAR|nr:hypothetical protein BXZ70DRAFT_941491 [Cristinia sonorae]
MSRRHPTLYFEDGDVVLSSDSADGVTTFYRIDKILLCRQSIIFREMFSLPMPEILGEMYDGVAWVRMPDPTEELERLLLAMYDVSTLPLKRRDPDTAILLSGAMKLAKKYEIESLRSLILRHLEGDWPQDAELWCDFRHDIANAIDLHLNNPPQFRYAGQYIDERFPEAASTLLFALDHNCPTLLRAASMLLIGRTSEWKSLQRDSRDMQYERLASMRVIHFPAVRIHLLTDAHLAALKKGAEALSAELKKVANAELPVVSRAGCRSCSDNLVVWREVMGKKVAQMLLQGPDPISVVRKLYGGNNRPETVVCQPCWARDVKAVKDYRQKLWEDLPAIFGWYEQMSR